MTVFWGFLLSRINITNKKLQSVDIDIFTVVKLYDSLTNLATTIRDDFDRFGQEGMNLSKVKVFEHDTMPTKTCKLLPDGTAEGVVLTGREKRRIETFTAVNDNLRYELRKRRDAHQ